MEAENAMEDSILERKAAIAKKKTKQAMKKSDRPAAGLVSLGNQTETKKKEKKRGRPPKTASSGR